MAESTTKEEQSKSPNNPLKRTHSEMTDKVENHDQPPIKKLKMEQNNNDDNQEHKEEKKDEIFHELTSRQQRKQDRSGYTQQERNIYRRKMKQERKRKEIEEMTEEERKKYRDEKYEQRMLKKQQKAIINKKLIDASTNGMKIGIDLCYNDIYNKHMEYTNIIKQLCYCWNANKCAKKAVSLHLLNVDKNWKKYFTSQGFYNWKGINIEENKDILDVFNEEKENVVYLTPDSDNILTEEIFKENEGKYIYIIGGIVDRSIKKLLSLNRANELKIKHYRLPLGIINLSGRRALNINNVFKILLRFQNEEEKWCDILNEEIPQRNKKQTKTRKNRGINDEDNQNDSNNIDNNDNKPIKSIKFVPRSLHQHGK